MKNTFLSIFLFTIFGLFAQEPKLSENFEISVGHQYQETDGKFKIFEKYNDGVVAVNRHKDDLVIQRFDPLTLKETERKEFENFFKEKYTKGFTKIIRVGDEIALFFSTWDRKEKISLLQFQAIALSDLKLSEPKALIQQMGKVEGGYSFNTTIKKDKLLIHYRLKPSIKNDSKSFDKISINVFDNTLSPIWNNVVEMPYSEKMMDNLDYAVDRKDNFYMIAKIYEDDSEKEEKKRKANYHLELFKVEKNTNHIVKSRITKDKKLIDQIMLYEDTNSNIVITGTTKNPDSKGFFNYEYGQATGVFAVKLDEKGNMGSFINHDFPLELLNKYASKKRGKKNNKQADEEDEKPAFYALNIHTIVVNDDASFILLGEQHYSVQTTSSSGKATYTTYHYGDIIAAKILPDGSLAWMHKLLKRQWGGRPKGTMSFSHMFAGENHYLLYLDNIKNLNLPENEDPHMHWEGKGGYFTVYIINDNSGKVKKEAVFNTLDFKDTKLEHFRTDKILPLSDSEILIEGFEGRSKDFLIKVSVKK